MGTPFEKGIPAAEASPGLNFNSGSARTRPCRWQERKRISFPLQEGILDLGNPEKFGGYVRLTTSEKEEIEIPHMFGYDGTPVSDTPDMIDYAYGHRGIGVAEEAWAIRQGRVNRLSKEFGYHAMEVLCGMGSAAESGQTCEIRSRFEMQGLRKGYMGTLMQGAMKADPEKSLWGAK